jgi:hypothetical protein
MQEKNDLEFQDLRKRAFGSQDDIIKEELDKFRREREKMNYIKTEDEKLFDKFMAEVHYRHENETRAKYEISDIQLNIQEIERSLATAKDIEKKKEFKQLLPEREALYKLENDLYETILDFKSFYDKWEYDRIAGKKFTPEETKAKMQKMNEIKAFKENIDYERKRARLNLEKIKAGDFSGIERNITPLLSKEVKKPVNNFTNLNAYSVDHLKFKLNNEGERVRNLKVILICKNNSDRKKEKISYNLNTKEKI